MTGEFKWKYQPRQKVTVLYRDHKIPCEITYVRFHKICDEFDAAPYYQVQFQGDFGKTYGMTVPEGMIVEGGECDSLFPDNFYPGNRTMFNYKYDFGQEVYIKDGDRKIPGIINCVTMNYSFSGFWYASYDVLYKNMFGENDVRFNCSTWDLESNEGRG